MSQQPVASIKVIDGPGNYCLNILSSLSLSDEDKLSLVIGDCLITFNKHIVCSLSPWISNILEEECCCLKGHVFITLPEETSRSGFQSLKEIIENGVTHQLAILDKDELDVAIKLLGMDIQLKDIDISEDFIKTVAVHECTSDKDDCDSIIPTEDMFTQNVKMDLEQTKSVEDMESDDTNNNRTLEPKTCNGMKENPNLSKDLEVLEEFNIANSLEDAQRNLDNMKPLFKKCEVGINRINRKNFGIMRNCCVKIKRLDRKFDKSLVYLKCTDTIAQELHKETRRNLKQRLPGDLDMCFPQASSSAAPAQPDNAESGEINFIIKEMDKSESLKSSRAIEKDNADSSMVPTPIDENNVDGGFSSGEMDFQCPYCTKMFGSATKLKVHKKSHTAVEPYQCSVCPKCFSLRSSLINHKKIHTGEKPYECVDCTKRFAFLHVLNKHKIIHTGGKPHPCLVCSKNFALLDALNRHKKIHTGEKPYQCVVCTKSFALMHVLNQHKMIHTGEKPYQCVVCPKSFSLRSSLINHKKIHTGEKPYQCLVCTKSFAYQHVLNQHNMIHTGEKP